MEDFTYDWPTRILFGRGTERKVGEEAVKHSRKVLLHYGGGSIKRTGLYDAVVESLKASGIDFLELPGVRPNPRLGLVKEGIELCRKHDVGLILAVGGGSVIDSAKAIGMGVPYDGDVWDFYSGRSEPKKSIPVGCVLTHAAAGSETSWASVITKEEGGYKRGARFEVMRPAFSILNPELTYTVPREQTAAGCVDIMSHVMERYFVNVSDIGLTDRLCEATLRSMIHYSRIALESPEDYGARANIMWAGTIAHNGILDRGRTKGDWSTHNIEHELSGMYDVTHGAGLATIFPAWMRYVYRNDIERFVRYAREVWGAKTDGMSKEKSALAGIDKTKEFFRGLGMPTSLRNLGIPDDRLDEMAEKCVEDGPIGKFVKLEKNDVMEILRLAR